MTPETAIEVSATAIIVLLLAALGWITWLYVQIYKELTQCKRDNYRLIRRIGLYHDLPLGLPDPDRKQRESTYPTETPVPPAFRTVRPKPPYGWHPDRPAGIQEESRR